MNSNIRGRILMWMTYYKRRIIDRTYSQNQKFFSSVQNFSTLKSLAVFVRNYKGLGNIVSLRSGCEPFHRFGKIPSSTVLNEWLSSTADGIWHESRRRWSPWNSHLYPLLYEQIFWTDLVRKYIVIYVLKQSWIKQMRRNK
mgnify:CR=1 FL=1